MDKNMTLEKRIDAELYSYQGRMSVFVDDLQGHTVERGADEEFETASVIKAFLLAALYLRRGWLTQLGRSVGAYLGGMALATMSASCKVVSMGAFSRASSILPAICQAKGSSP